MKTTLHPVRKSSMSKRSNLSLPRDDSFLTFSLEVVFVMDNFKQEFGVLVDFGLQMH